MLSINQCWRCDKVTDQGKRCRKCHEAYYCSDRCSNADEFRHSSDCHNVALRYICRGCRRRSNEKMMMCCNCMSAWFCGRECLKKAWAAHKTECKEVSKTVRKLAPVLLYQASCLPAGNPTLYYFGNTPALDLLNLSMNEGCEYSEELSLLLCGVGDPRNVCLTISKLQTTGGKVNFVLNDICACTLARTVLLLYLLCKVGQDAAASVTQIWYSLYLSHDDHALVVSCLKDLVRISSLDAITRGIMQIGDVGHLNKLKEVWMKWLDLSQKEINLAQQRRQIFHDDPKSAEGMKYLLEEIPDRYQHSMAEWFRNGVLLIERERKKATKENFTLTGSAFQPFNNSGPFVYSIGSDCMPFCGWDYRDVIGAYPESSDVNELYNRYITDVLTQCAAHLQSDRIHISFILCNCQDITTCIPPSFDRITVSNLWDYIRLARLFILLKPLLNQTNKSAALVTETHNWHYYFPSFDMKKIATVNSPESRRKIFQDTCNRKIAESYGTTSFHDYFSITEEFTCFARASFLLGDSKPLTSLIPSLDQLAAKFGLKPRDFTCHGNRISPFRWKLNCRRLTMMRGSDVSVEWTLL